MRKNKYLNFVKETLVLIILALAITLIVKVFIAQAFKVEMNSMTSTVLSGERVLAERISYYFRNPRRKEIVIFNSPEITSNKSPLTILTGKQKTLIKRVVGLPGEKIEVKKGKTYINGKEIEEDYRRSDSRSFGPTKIPKDKIYVMGDNRPKSYDSREFGPVPMKSIAGRAIFSYWPITKIRLLTDK